MFAFYLAFLCALVANLSTFLSTSGMGAFLRTIFLAWRTLLTAFVFALMIANVKSSAILFTFSMEELLEAVTTFFGALVVAFENSIARNFASFFFEIFFRVLAAWKV